MFGVITSLVPEPELPGAEGAHAHGGGKEGEGKRKKSKEEEEEERKRKNLLMTGVIAAVGIRCVCCTWECACVRANSRPSLSPLPSLHNFPEGIVVYNATIAGVCDEPVDTLMEYGTKCLGRGLAVAGAIALHNIPGALCARGPRPASSAPRASAASPLTREGGWACVGLWLRRGHGCCSAAVRVDQEVGWWGMRTHTHARTHARTTACPHSLPHPLPHASAGGTRSSGVCCPPWPSLWPPSCSVPCSTPTSRRSCWPP